MFPTIPKKMFPTIPKTWSQSYLHFLSTNPTILKEFSPLKLSIENDQPKNNADLEKREKRVEEKKTNLKSVNVFAFCADPNCGS